MRRSFWLGAALIPNIIFAAKAVPVNALSSAEINQYFAKSVNSTYGVKSLTESEDKNGVKHFRYQQLYKGLPVYGHHILKHVNNSNKAMFTGNVVQEIHLDLADVKPVAGFSKDVALAQAKETFIKKSKMVAAETVFTNEKSELSIYQDKKNGEAKLVYIVSFFADAKKSGKPARPFYVIDAKTKELVHYWNNLNTDKEGYGPGGNLKTGFYLYGSSYEKLDVRVDDSGWTKDCYMENSDVRTVHMNYQEWGDDTYSFPCYWSGMDAINGAASPLNDAHFFGNKIVEMYHNWYDTTPLPFQLVMRTHYGFAFENAFWDGETMTFGDGFMSFYPLVAADVAAHEVSHGVTQFNSNLQYEGQSGGMNESFSDMAGEAMKFYIHGHNNWKVGSDIARTMDALRYMDDPTKDGMSIGDARDYSDDLDVHFTSGVYNKAFYLLATHDGWNVKKAFEVMLDANKHYWTPFSTYTDAADGVMQSAKNLGYDVNAVVATFAGVGIDCSEDSCQLMQ